MNTGHEPVSSTHQLLTTIAWQRKGSPPIYALDSIVYAAGALVEWMKNSLNLYFKSEEIEIALLERLSLKQIIIFSAFSSIELAHSISSSG